MTLFLNKMQAASDMKSEYQKYFITPSGVKLDCLTKSEFENLLNRLNEEYCLTHFQVIESAAICLSMVVKHSLSYNTLDANITLFADYSFKGAITLAAGRILANSGAKVSIYLLGDDLDYGLILSSKLALQALNIEVKSDITSTEFKEVVSYTNQFVLGIDTKNIISYPFISQLNNIITPIHSVQMPIGIDDDTVIATKSVFASTTLSIGVPLASLTENRDVIGKHYLCDISIPYYQLGLSKNREPIFSNQPLIELIN
jgi:NAD(P)H-hydrate repair Nnr-like enzyme with NAD(P)H-hydrate epimerase domain